MKTALVVTTIASPNPCLKALAKGCRRHNWGFFIIGDEKTPHGFNIPGAAYFDLAHQHTTGLSTAWAGPTGHYARKNVGYLLAMRNGAEVIVETDDDNCPLSRFWDARERVRCARFLEGCGWTNVYPYFTKELIWPRGFPLEFIHQNDAPMTAAIRKTNSPIQQGLANHDPDVDAVFRLVFGRSVKFKQNSKAVSLGQGLWSPFNSQNTTWWKEAFPLLYLPATCSFRMTDIWRSYVAQWIAWGNGWNILFHAPTVRQRRYPHNLLEDLKDEIPGYLNAERIRKLLLGVSIKRGIRNIPQAMILCYEALIDHGIVAKEERKILVAWISDIKAL